MRKKHREEKSYELEKGGEKLGDLSPEKTTPGIEGTLEEVCIKKPRRKMHHAG